MEVRGICSLDPGYSKQVRSSISGRKVRRVRYEALRRDLQPNHCRHREVLCRKNSVFHSGRGRRIFQLHVSEYTAQQSRGQQEELPQLLAEARCVDASRI